MKKTMHWLVVVWTILALLLGACQAQSGQPSAANSSTPVFVTGWNIDQSSDPMVVANQSEQATMARARWLQAYQNKGLVMNFGCCDGRASRGFALGAQQYADGAPDMADYSYVDTGSLAASLGDESWIQSYIEYWTIRTGVVTAADVAAHCGGNSTCGAQGVMKQMQDDPNLAAKLEGEGLGLTANHIKGYVFSTDPAVQAIYESMRVYEYAHGTIEVTAWVFDHEKQWYQPIAQWMPGQGLVATVIPLEGLTPETKWDGSILSPDQLSARAKAMLYDSVANAPKAVELMAQAGLKPAEGQAFSNVVFSDSPYPSELVLGDQVWKPDQVFNANVMVSPDAPLADFQSALDGAFAAGNYGITHANEGTKIYGVFSSVERAQAFLDRFYSEGIVRKFLADPAKNEVRIYVADQTGAIVQSLLVKPALTAVLPETTIGPEFRGMPLIERATIEGAQYGLIHGDETSPFGSTWVTMNSTSLEYHFARVYPKLEQAQFHVAVLQAQDPEHKDLYRSVQYGSGGAAMSDKDLGEPLLQYLERTGQMEKLPEYLAKAQERANEMFSKGYASTDVHAGNILVDKYGGVNICDWAPNTTLTGDRLKARFADPVAYLTFWRRELNLSLKFEGKRFPQLQEQLPLRWPALGPQRFATTFLADETATAFEGALADLGSADPAVVAAARNALRGMGALQLDGQWVILGQSSSYASGPIRLSTLRTSYPDGVTSFFGFQTENVGVIGLQRAENTGSGIWGWNLYAPRLSLQGKTVMGMPVTDLLSQGIGDVLLYASVVMVVSDVKDQATQTEYVAVGPNTLQTLVESPAAADYHIFTSPMKWKYVSTTLNVSLADLQSGCNQSGFPAGCGAYIPVGSHVPLILLGTLAGDTLPEQGFPDVGLGGHSVLSTWSYAREDDGSYYLWHDGQSLFPGESMDYVEFKLNEWGAWWIPYHAEMQTATCAGFCVQQVVGGEEMIFATDQWPRQVELCPAPNDPSVCWRP